MRPDKKIKNDHSLIKDESGSLVNSRERLPATSKPQRVQEGDLVREIGGPAGPEPTRYGDWQVNGRCSDF